MLRHHFNKKRGLLLALALAQPAAASQARARFIMGTVCELDAPGASEAAVTAAFDEISRWDAVLSLYKPQSEASRVNREAEAAAVPVSQDYWDAAALALEMARRSEGAFDPTLKARGHADVELDAAARTVRFRRPGLRLDFGGIGKGLALDRAAAVLRRAGVKRALFNFGGQLHALGGPWRVETAAGPVYIKDASVSTSGDSERPGHILSPLTGLPVAGPDVTVVAPTAAEADAWSTAIYVTQGRQPAAFKACEGCRLIRTGGAS